MPFLKQLTLPHGKLIFPTFLPDGTQGVVRAVDARDIEATKIQALVMNTFHLMQKPGSSTIQALGGLHAMSGWDGPILTDSGGVQEEACILGIPCVTLRDNTERPETVEVGANRLAGATPDEILSQARVMLNRNARWPNPFGDGKAAERIVGIALEDKNA